MTVWRELRRLDAGDVGDPILAALVAAADMGGDEESQLNGWARFVNLMGGWNVKRAELTAKVWRAGAVDVETGEIRYNRYGELAGAVVRGVLCLGEAVKTRVRTWVFEQGRKPAQPRSSVNNCTGENGEQEKTSGRIGREGGENGSGGAVFYGGGGNPRGVDGDGGAAGGFWRRD